MPPTSSPKNDLLASSNRSVLVTSLVAFFLFLLLLYDFKPTNFNNQHHHVSSSSGNNNNYIDDSHNQNDDDHSVVHAKKHHQNIGHDVVLVTSPPSITTSQHSPSSSFLHFTPKKSPSKTKSGITLFNYELPFTKTDQFLTVNYTPPSSDWRPRQGLTFQNHPSEEKMFVQIPIEPVDVTIRIMMSTRHCSKAADKGACFHQAADAGMELLYKGVTSKIKEHLLGDFVTIPANTRRVYFDLGARTYDSKSTKWFKENYPHSELFEASAFEMEDRFRKTFPIEQLQKHFKKWEFVNKAVWIHDDGIETNGEDMGAIVDSRTGKSVDGRGSGGEKNTKNKKTTKDGQQSLASLVGKQQKMKTQQPKRLPSVDFAQFLLDNYKKEDFLVVKMDIEGAEWKVLERMIETGAIELVDEMMLECHISERSPTMHPRCVDLINLMRQMGIVCHRWI